MEAGKAIQLSDFRRQGKDQPSNDAARDEVLAVMFEIIARAKASGPRPSTPCGVGAGR
jgi:hypothetical protein